VRLSTVLPALALASIALFAAACSTTLVRYLPAGDTTTCDAAWPGVWTASSPAPTAGAPDIAWVEVSADCRQLTFTDREKTSIENRTLTLVTTGAGQFLSVTDADGKPDCLGKDNTDCGLPLWRYEREGEDIRLYAAAHQVVHDAIARGDVQGVSQINSVASSTGASPAKKPTKQGNVKPPSTPPDTYQNLLIDTPEQVGQVLFDHPEFFDDRPWLVLHRDSTDTRPKPPAAKP
jgi:hypothetical protein